VWPRGRSCVQLVAHGRHLPGGATSRGVLLADGIGGAESAHRELGLRQWNRRRGRRDRAVVALRQGERSVSDALSKLFWCFRTVVLNLFAERSQIQTYEFVRKSHKKCYHKSIDTFCFITEPSLLHKMLGFIERRLRTTQRALGSRMGLSGQWLRTTVLEKKFLILKPFCMFAEIYWALHVGDPSVHCHQHDLHALYALNFCPCSFSARKSKERKSKGVFERHGHGKTAFTLIRRDHHSSFFIYVSP